MYTKDQERKMVGGALISAAAFMQGRGLAQNGHHGEVAEGDPDWDPFYRGDDDLVQQRLDNGRFKAKWPKAVCTMGAIVRIADGCEVDAAIALCRFLNIDYSVYPDDEENPTFHPAVQAIHDWNDWEDTKWADVERALRLTGQEVLEGRIRLGEKN